MRILLSALALAGAVTTSFAEWKPEYAASSPEVQHWYLTRELTPETRARLGVSWTSCCAHSDVVKTKFHVDHKSGGDEWFYLSETGWKRVPPDTIHWGEHAPGGKPTLFIYNGQETCFFPGDGGI